ncbi:MAG: hypothetical protein ACXW3E_10065, partial [Thermoanaerobaculia bacterium]
MNQLWLHEDLRVDDLSFLGREAPSWDVIFWCIAGLFAIAVVHSGDASMSDWRAAGREIRSIRIALPRRFLLFLPGLAAIIAVMWLTVDAPLVAIAERVQSDTVESIIRVFNRLAGGMNPPMIVLFFMIAGVAYRRDRWMRIGMAMALAGLSAGLVAHILKFIV